MPSPAPDRHALSLLDTVERTMAMKTDSSRVPSEMRRAVREFGVIPLGTVRGIDKPIPHGSVDGEGYHAAYCRQAPVPKYWH